MLPRLTGNNINSRNKTKLQPEGFPEDACFNTWLLEHTGPEERRVNVCCYYNFEKTGCLNMSLDHDGIKFLVRFAF